MNISMPELGGGATLSNGRDREGGTVIGTFTKGRFQYVSVQEDSKKRVDNNGMSEDQTYEYTSNPNGRIYNFRLEEKGWVEVVLNKETGRWNKPSYGERVFFGARRAFYDFSF